MSQLKKNLSFLRIQVRHEAFWYLVAGGQIITKELAPIACATSRVQLLVRLRVRPQYATRQLEKRAH